jgi:uncharacterized protein (TIGR02722 family)
MNSTLSNCLLAGALASALSLSACSSTTDYKDPSEVETTTHGYGLTDLHIIAGEMAEKMVLSPNLNYLENPAKGDDKRILLAMGTVNNRTSEHIDVAGITDSIRAKLLESGKFRILATGQGQDDLGDQVRFQQGSGRVDSEWAREFGKQLGAELVLYGNLRSIDKEKSKTFGGKVQDTYYQFVLEAVNVETGEILFLDQVEIRKVTK